ncbi:MAG: tetraacyldisaccharide 4'-kinase [Pseudomonadota bacterium]
MSPQAFWSRKGPLNFLLLPLSLLFAVLVALRRWAYRNKLLRSGHPGVPVIVAGNLTAGGSGKTPFVIWLVQWLQAQGRRPGVVSRGYGREEGGLHEVSEASTAAQAGDEPVLVHLKTGVPVVAGTDRLAAARLLRARHPEVDVIVSDDGLQHYRLQRDLELVLADDAARFGNGWLQPAGPLREPLSRLKKADALILSVRGAHEGAAVSDALPVFRVRHRAGICYRLLDPQQTCALGELAGRRVLAVAGVARPDAFFAQLENAGLDVRRLGFPDHHAYRPGDIDATATVVMTEKDAVKCRQFAGPEWWVLKLELQPDPQLENWLVEKLAQLAEKT